MSAFPDSPPQPTAAGLAPPHSIEAEQSVLGAILLSDKVHDAYVIEEGLRPEDFYRERHQIIYESMLALYNESEPIDVVTVTEHLRARGADHAVEDGLPYGCTVEAVRLSALSEANRLASQAEDREHVTTFLRRSGSGFRCLTPAAPAWLRRPDIRFTVDTAADLAYMQRVFDEAGGAADLTIPLADLIAAADGLRRTADVA